MQKVGGILLCTVILTINSAVNAQLKVNSDGIINIEKDFEIELGSSLEIGLHPFEY